MLAGQLTAALGWGMLIVCDREADHRQVPDGPSRPHPAEVAFRASGDAIIIFVMHGQFGAVTARVWLGADEAGKRGEVDVGACALHLRSGTLIIGDVVNDVTTTIAVPPGAYRVLIGADTPLEPTEIDLVLQRIRDRSVRS